MTKTAASNVVLTPAKIRFITDALAAKIRNLPAAAAMRDSLVELHDQINALYEDSPNSMLAIVRHEDDHASMTTSELLAKAYECADDCDTCWYLCSTSAHEEIGDDAIAVKLRAHFASGHMTLSEDEVTS